MVQLEQNNHDISSGSTFDLLSHYYHASSFLARLYSMLYPYQ